MRKSTNKPSLYLSTVMKPGHMVNMQVHTCTVKVQDTRWDHLHYSEDDVILWHTCKCKLSYYFQYESYHSIPRTSHTAHAANVETLIATHVAVTECSWDHVAPDLVPRPHRLKRKMVWWLLSNLLVVPTQQYWFQITCLHDVRPISLVYAHAWKLDDVAQFQWIVQNQDCWLSTTKKLLNSHQTLFLVRGWGLGTRLCSTTLQEYRLGCGLG